MGECGGKSVEVGGYGGGVWRWECGGECGGESVEVSVEVRVWRWEGGGVSVEVRVWRWEGGGERDSNVRVWRWEGGGEGVEVGGYEGGGSVEVYVSMHEGCSDCVESTCDCNK